MVIGDHHLYPREPAALEATKQILVGGLALGVGDLYGYYLTEAVVSYCLGYKHSLADDP